MNTGIRASSSRTPTTLGWVAIACALLGLLALFGYGTFATRGIHAAAARDMVAAHRMASYAGSCSFAQLVFGLLAVGLGWVAKAPGNPRLAWWLGALACGLGVLVLVLQVLIII